MLATHGQCEPSQDIGTWLFSANARSAKVEVLKVRHPGRRLQRQHGRLLQVPVPNSFMTWLPYEMHVDPSSAHPDLDLAVIGGHGTIAVAP